jgi:CheY-like chemotaxis protein
MGHDLTVTVPPEPMYVNGDPARLAQVVGNLLTNACKFSCKGGRVSLSAEREGEEAVVRVRDNGIGIAADQLARIFDMFVQVDTSVERSVGGLGIGLTLVKNLVELHGGSIKAESLGSGKGSTFTVRLPLASDGAKRLEPTAEDIAAPATAGRRILVVDDNVDGAESLSRVLDLSGHTTRTAYTGHEAIETARAFSPEVVFLDIGLPGMSGYEVGKQFRADPDLKGVVLIALTGWGSEDDRLRSHEAGFDFHLTKPVGAAAVEELLARFSPLSRAGEVPEAANG